MIKKVYHFISRLLSNPIATFLGGVISTIVLALILPYIQSEPDFFVTVDYPYTRLNNTTDTISVFVHNQNEKYFKSYDYPISLIFREEGYNSMPKGIIANSKEQNFDLAESTDSRIKKEVTLHVSGATGPHLIEILAIGGDGKVRSTHLVVDT
jgi:hypothetical protein